MKMDQNSAATNFLPLTRKKERQGCSTKLKPTDYEIIEGMSKKLPK